MSDVTFRFDDNGLREAIRRHPQAMFGVMRTAIRNLLSVFHSKLGNRMRMGPPGLRVRTGDLLRSRPPGGGRIVGDSLASLTGFYTLSSKYARIQEYGGTIVPKRGRYLSIPLNLTAGGVRRDYSPLQYLAGPGGKLTFLKPGKFPGTLLVMLRQGARRPPLPLFLLAKRVQLVPRLGFFNTWDEMGPQREVEQKRLLDRAVELLAKG